MAKLEESLKAVETETKATKKEVVRSNLELNRTKEEKESLSTEMDQIVDAIMDEHENGFNKDLRQVALLAPDLDLSYLTMTHDVIDGKLVPMVSLEEKMESVRNKKHRSWMDGMKEFDIISAKRAGTNPKSSNGV
ncbi:hypothetical protein CR513_53811, partial [Mucuna pruriens]